MPNINKIKLSGTSYDIQDLNAPKTVTLTQAQYDALVDKDPNTFYIISDASTGDLSQYWTSAQTQSAITQATSGITERIGEDEEVTAAALNTLNDAVSGKVDTTAFTAYSASVETALSGKQDTLVSSQNIKTINNTSILGSGNITIQGGPTYTAGRGIDITNDTISFSLPISAGTNENLIIGDTSNKVNDPYNSGKSIVFGRYSTVKSYDSLVGGYYCSNEKGQSQVFGNRSKTKNQYEFGCGKYNNSVSGSSTFGDSGNTLFSVGNGTAENARHNAFEIRQNGDIYLTLDGQDVKLQDHLGGSSITVDSALSSTSENPVQNKVIYNKIDEVEQVTARALNELNDVISGKADTSAVTEVQDSLSGYVATSAVTSAVTSGSTSVITSGGVYEQMGGLKLLKLTQLQYDALVTKDSNTLYVIVN